MIPRTAGGPAVGGPAAASRRLTPLGGRVLTLGLVLAMLATMVGSRDLLLAGAFAAALPLMALLTLRRPPLVVTVTGGEQARVGVPLTSTVTVRTTAARPCPPLIVHLLRPLLPGAVGALDGPGPGEVVVWSAETVPAQRGVAEVAHVQVAVCDDFGLAFRRWALTVPAPLRVAPAVVAPPALPAPPPVGVTEPGDLRPWRPGESTTAIAWRASARRGGGPVPTLLVRTRLPEEPGELRLAVTGGSPAAVEQALAVAAALGTATLAGGRALAVHLDRGWIRPASADALLDALTRVAVLATDPPVGDGQACDVLIACADLIPPSTGVRLVVDAAGTVRRC